MECYKEVEKNSKMKSFSNQSIMLAALDQGGRELSQEALEAYEFLSSVVDDLNEQNEELEEEYEKLSQKKSRKGTLNAVEERKQEVENFKLRNEQHVEEIETIMSYLKTRKVSVDLVLAIQEDLRFYVESNQDPDFVDDDTLYDDLKREARENHEKNALVAVAEDSDMTGHESGSTTLVNGDASASPDPLQNDSASHIHEKSHSKFNSPSPSAAVSDASSKNTSGGAFSLSQAHLHLSPKDKFPGRIDTSDISSPGFITNLKPAATPTKPVGALKWSLAAAGASQSQDGTNGSSHETFGKAADAVPSNVQLLSTPVIHSESNGSAPVPEHLNNSENVASLELLSLLTKNDKYSAHLEVLKNSNLLPVENELFSDVELLEVPAGIQEFTLAYTSTNKATENSKLLRCPSVYTPYATFIDRPDYSVSKQSLWKPVALLSKLSNYWQIIRTNNKFEQYVNDLEIYSEKAPVEAMNALNELTMVLFYGLYYGLLPLENIIAESYLFKLGWKPYFMELESPKVSQGGRKQPRTQCWLKKLGPTTTTIEGGVQCEVGDFRAFDARTWEIHVKTAFRFDPRLSQPMPSRTLL
ncbi:hypothetical protein PUMCH_002007 [Australozyma saopauloensis]|uniref:CCR4-Not complex component Not N-terminal domain-containing protein n=1 Tax=Australozyma saopauloensis TaxID=291208 RepID=A0AAX4H8B4_9ASCO|nr:hypothetical protein PUMCH_002007 [[Candida] saopauloensis]